jgi:hypothetical protein
VVGDSHVEIATILVANGLVTAVTITAGGGVSARYKTRTRARVGSVGSRDGVGLPDVHLGAASTDLAGSRVGVSGGGVPSLEVGLAVDVLDVVGALRIAVTGSELGTGFVVALAEATVGGHLDEVQGTVQTARQLGGVDIEGELLADEVEHLVLGVGLHQVGTGPNVGAAGALGNELQGQSVAARGDTVGT